jgi:hypothetical protein
MAGSPSLDRPPHGDRRHHVMSTAYGGADPGELDRWIERGEEVLALFDCALRSCQEENRSIALRTVLDLMARLEHRSRDVGGRVLAHFDACLSDLERGDFEHAFEGLLDLRESWMEAMATLRKDRDRAANLN